MGFRKSVKLLINLIMLAITIAVFYLDITYILEIQHGWLFILPLNFVLAKLIYEVRRFMQQ